VGMVMTCCSRASIRGVEMASLGVAGGGYQGMEDEEGIWHVHCLPYNVLLCDQRLLFSTVQHVSALCLSFFSAAAGRHCVFFFFLLWRSLQLLFVFWRDYRRRRKRR